MFGIDVRTVSYLRWYCRYVSNFLRFGTADDGWFLVFGAPNAKYLAFGTPDESALILGNLLYLKRRLRFIKQHGYDGQ